ncbi:DUF2513 domain-containing protein [Silvanigrella paludirubra]|uniref:DUF2513 domain-containing protein n=1 Tax=Silvanigrella paludirubra TaxID=2499159 RepID=A0A6N6VMT7_9BACT|nr:DUF2513 domain-containing protein [Silvanigrella paludirubra]KAB8035863.1 DUF2513 domain-containing protein [Silvanigrella paludirubra]
MNIDQNLLKEVLLNAKNGLIKTKYDSMEIPCDGLGEYSFILCPNKNIDPFEEENKYNEEIEYIKTLAYHLKILIDNNYLYGEIRKTHPFYMVSINGLTLSGHQFLETLSNDNILKKVIEKIGNISLDTVSKVPALAIGAIINSSLK